MRLARTVAFAALASSACQFEQPADVKPPDATVDAPPCVPSTTTCEGSTLSVCDADGRLASDTCGFGCAPAGDRCLDLVPSNGLETYLEQSGGELAIVLTGDATIDTTTGEIRNGDGALVATRTEVLTGGPVERFVWIVRSLSVGNVTVTGTRAFAIVASGDVVVNGVVSVSAQLHVPGPGALTDEGNGCAGHLGFADMTGGAGGGGGGFGTAGGQGGPVGTLLGGAGGGLGGDATLSPLRGGCRGGHGGRVMPPMYRQPGAGGGAIQIATRGSIVLQPGTLIAANGGGAKSLLAMSGGCGSFPKIAEYCHEGAGGGSGGAILLEAARVGIPLTAGLVANGGAGHCGFLGSARNGENSEMPALGTSCTQLSAGTGGNGAAASTPASNGTGGPWEAAGGGGGAGRIRINLPAGQLFDPGPPIISPLPSLGVCATR